jgi:DNA replication licensing factor MCM2
MHLTNKYPTLGIWVAEDPTNLLPILNVAAHEITLELFPEYNRIHKEIFIRIGNLPVNDSIRELRQINMNSLIKIRGVVVKRTNVLPEMNKMYFKCVCGDIKGPLFHQN